MTHPGKPAGFRRPGRKDRLLQEFEHDPYKVGAKPPEPTRCGDCGAVFHAGRWQWSEAPEGAHESVCPACRRAREGLPGGYLTLSGDFFAAHREEVLHLVRHVETRERAEHPLDRVMAVESERNGRTVVTFTDAHLARGAGEAILHAYQGDLAFHYTEADPTLRVAWHR